jgi:hypothetical protein
MRLLTGRARFDRRVDLLRLFSLDVKQIPLVGSWRLLRTCALDIVVDLRVFVLARRKTDFKSFASALLQGVIPSKVSGLTHR